MAPKRYNKKGIVHIATWIIEALNKRKDIILREMHCDGEFIEYEYRYYPKKDKYTITKIRNSYFEASKQFESLDWATPQRAYYSIIPKVLQEQRYYVVGLKQAPGVDILLKAKVFKLFLKRELFSAGEKLIDD